MDIRIKGDNNGNLLQTVTKVKPTLLFNRTSH